MDIKLYELEVMPGLLPFKSRSKQCTVSFIGNMTTPVTFKPIGARGAMAPPTFNRSVNPMPS